jgi:hypothetical protein
MQFQAQIQITMYAHTLKTKERAYIVGMSRVGMRSKNKNKEEMRQTVQGVWDQVSLEQLQMLISSMPNRMQTIIQQKIEALDGR